MALSQAEFHSMAIDHGPVLYRMAYRMIGDVHEAEDVVQEAFRSAWKSRRTFTEGRGQRAWLAAILRRRVVDRWRRRPPPSTLSGEGEIEIAVPAEDFTAEEYTDEMQRALGKLSPDLREALLMVVVAELTHQEAADVLEIPLGTVLSRVSRARQRLRKTLLAEVTDSRSDG